MKIDEYWISPFVPLTGNGFIDVGAHVCTWTKWLSPGYKFVHAIEPFKEAIDGAGKLPDNVTMHPFGAWSKEARIHFGTGIGGSNKLLYAQEDINSWFAEIGINHPMSGDSMVLPCHTLDSMIPEKDQISLMKIDTEGAELQVILGCPEIIEASHPFIIVEIHSRLNAPEIERILREQKYDLEIIRSPYYHENNPEHRAHWGNHYYMLCR